MGLVPIGDARLQETFTADAVGEFLRKNQPLVYIESGGISCSVLFHGMVSTAAILRDLHRDAHSVPEEKKATVLVLARLGVRCLFLGLVTFTMYQWWQHKREAVSRLIQPMWRKISNNPSALGGARSIGGDCIKLG